MTAKVFQEHLVKNLIPFWNRMEDTENGGFYGYADSEGNPDKQHTKGCILNSRILWFYAAAYQLLKQPELLEKADHAYNLYHVIESKCRDSKGYFEAFSRDFSPVSNEKLSENGVIAERTMNTLLHVLEAYTELYSADKFYGHDIEASWLIDRACHVLGDKAYYAEMLPVIKELADGAYKNGIDTRNHVMNHECEDGIINAKKSLVGSGISTSVEMSLP